jgi:hypothetical protein
MFRKYSQKFWKRKKTTSGRQRLFDPKKLSMKRIGAIDARIESREKMEQDRFDKAFAAELAKL